MTRWAANLSTLYREHPFVERFARARADGFDTVEFWWPRGEDLPRVAEAVHASALRVALLNIDAGDMAAGERGYFSIAGRAADALRATREAVAFARSVGCTQLNALVGNRTGGDEREQFERAKAGLRDAAAEAERAGVRLLIEALNVEENARYLVHTTERAREVVAAVGHGARLQYDAYHMGKMGEDIVAAAKDLGRGEIGHVQLADAPGRHEPGTGALPLDAFLAELDASSYAGYVGLEYIPATETSAGLGWLRERRHA